MTRIDREVNALLADTSGTLGPEAVVPTIEPLMEVADATPAFSDPVAETLETVDPAAADLSFDAASAVEQETDQVVARLREYTIAPEGARQMDLGAALAYAMEHSREYRFAEEEYVLAALRLLIEEHRWGPRFFNDLTTTFESSGDGGTFDSSVRIVNELQVTQRLPYGGTVGARALATATEDLHNRVAGGGTQTAELIFEADVPLLRGAGTVAREDLIQRRRDMIYAARDFERFRRDFLVDIAQEFLQLVVDKRGIENRRRSVESRERLEAEQVALWKEGRARRFDAALAENDTVEARDNLNISAENFRLSKDRFKVRIGMEPEEPLFIVESTIGLPVPEVTMRDAVLAAMAYRLDLQNTRDQVDDFRRGVSNAKNALLPDLNVGGSVSIPTDDDRDRAGLRFDGEDSEFEATITFGLPLDREIERLNVRQAQIQLERAARAYDRDRDSIAVEVRAAVRTIDTALFSLQIQERGIEIAEQRKASLEADPAAATARNSSEAEDALLEAQDARDRARRGLEVAILRYLLDSGQLRVNAQGTILPLEGMELNPQIGALPNANPVAP
ncbi:MAG: TolC family protein [Planctomycetota bacterium]